jgi:hypothetical protein
METLTNDLIRLQIATELGGKIVSLVRRASGFEFLLQAGDVPASPVRYGDAYTAARSYGYDECVPTVDPCSYPLAPFAGVELPDHGELWSTRWEEKERTATSMTLAANGRALPYRFQRTLVLQEDVLRIVYSIWNESDVAFHYSWTAHPLLSAREGTRIIFPAAVTESIDAFRVVQRGSSTMRFTRRLNATEGWCAVIWPDAGETIEYTFDPARVPYIGIWITNGGWPPHAPDRQYAIAVEPCLSRNSLAQAVARREAPLLPARGDFSWELQLKLLGDR